MRCPDEPQLKQDEGHEQDGDTGDITTALYQQSGLRFARREACRHLVSPSVRVPDGGLPTNVKILKSFQECSEDTWRA